MINSFFRFLTCLFLTCFCFLSQALAQGQLINDSAFSLDSSRTMISACSSGFLDTDGDGWGWENMETCHVGGEYEYKVYSNCKSSNSDPDGDGWGWEDGESCKVSKQSEEIISQTSQNNSAQPETAAATSVNTKPVTGSKYDEKINIDSARSNGGFAYMVRQDFGVPGDSEGGELSTLRIFEDGKELKPAHTLVERVRDTGKGRFTHWGSNLFFSTSDNTDPRSNGRVYTFLRGNSSTDSQVNITGNCADYGGDVDSTDPKTRLLASLDRIGYGCNATGGTDYVYVKNFAELRKAMQTSGSYVLLDSSLSGKGIGFTGPIYTSSDVTLDGSLAPGSYFYPIYPGFPVNTPMINNSFGSYSGDGNNVIYNQITLRGQRSPSYDKNHPSYNVGGLNLRSKDIWVNKVEITNFWDDAIVTAQRGDNITISNIKIHNTDKGISAFYDSDTNRSISIFNSELSAEQRTPASSASNLHLWNNYIHDVRWGAHDVGFASAVNSSNISGVIRSFSENNVFENTIQAAEWAFTFENREHTQAPGSIFSHGNIYNGHRNHNVTFTSDRPWDIPYNYWLMPASEVKAYVIENAGPN